MLSLKLAANNIKKGFKSFAPFLMASITMFVMIFVTASIALSPSIHKLKGGEALSQIMGFALIVLSIFAVLILIYSYRFLQTQRSREFGLYDILGLVNENCWCSLFRIDFKLYHYFNCWNSLWDCIFKIFIFDFCKYDWWKLF